MVEKYTAMLGQAQDQQVRVHAKGTEQLQSCRYKEHGKATTAKTDKCNTNVGIQTERLKRDQVECGLL